MSSFLHSLGRIHITGGRGRLASIVAAHLRSRGFQVELYSRTAGGGFKDLNLLIAGKAVAPQDTVLHLAWSSLPATSEQHPGGEEAEDLPLLERLLATVSVPGLGPKPHFVFFSSGGAVYGNAGTAPSREVDACFPVGSYGRAKLAAESIIQRFQATGSCTCAILRISNPYGHPGNAARPQGVINRAIACALSGAEFVIWGDGGARKDYLYEDDFVAAVEGTVRHRLVGTYNLCMGKSHTVNEVIAAVEASTGRRVTRRNTPAPAWDVQDSRLDGSLLERASSWRPSVAFHEGVRRAVARFVAAATPTQAELPCQPN